MTSVLAPMEIFANFLQLFKHFQYKDVYFVAPALTSFAISVGLICVRHVLTKGVKRKRTLFEHTMRVMDWGSTTSLIFFTVMLSTFGYLPAYLTGSLACFGSLIFYLHREAVKLDEATSKRKDDGTTTASHLSISFAKFLKQSISLLKYKYIRNTAILLALGIWALTLSSSSICIPDEPNELHMSTRLTRWLAGDPCSGLVPCFVYLTAPENLSSSVVVHFHLHKEPHTCITRYGTESGKLTEETVGWHVKVPIEISRYVCHVQLQSLAPDTTYYFVAGADPEYLSAERKFRTATADPNAPLHFVAGGDMGAYANTVTLTRIAVQTEPIVALIGGDLGYDEGFYTCYPRWDWWLKLISHDLVTPNGFTVPMVVAIGNHDGGGYGLDADESPFYYAYFAQASHLATVPIFERKSYHYHLLGANTLLLSLDSGITATETGEQSLWMEEMFRTFPVTHRLALYHVPLYPARRNPANENSKRVRNAWRHLFDKHNLTIGFENHDHAYKRTHLLRNETIDSSGTLYIGDGSWGVPATRPVLRWYDEKIAATGFILRVTIHRNSIYIASIDEQGAIFDSWEKK